MATWVCQQFLRPVPSLASDKLAVVMNVPEPQPTTPQDEPTAVPVVPAVQSQWNEPRWYRSKSLWVVLVGFALALAMLWNNGFSIAMADGIAYITGGMNLVHTGEYRNPYGEYETWFPPLYPLLIGLASWGGRFDPVLMARLICAGFSLWALVLVWQATLLGTGGRRLPAVLASMFLAGNAMYQLYGMAVMSHAVSTALGLAAFVVWLRLDKTAPISRLIALGVLIGSGFLVRPEVLLTLPLWLLIDAFSHPLRETLRRTLIAGLACAVLVVPYAFYLHAITGEWQLSAKGEVTVAIGRGIYYGGPREQIDPESLELEYTTFVVTPMSELKRYGFNVVQMLQVVGQTLRTPLGWSLLLISAIGIRRLAYERRWRFLLGLAAQLVFLAAIAATWCEDRMLHAFWPVWAILAGVGAELLIRLVKESPRPIWKALAGLLLAWTALAWLEGATRQPRWSYQEGVGPKALLREAGLAFREQTAQQPRGAMYELGATVGFYSGQYRRPLPTVNDLDTLIRYAQKRDTPIRPAWLALWTSEAEAYHPTLKAPFLADALPLKKVLERTDAGARVTIYEIPPPFVPGEESGGSPFDGRVHTSAGDLPQ